MVVDLLHTSPWAQALADVGRWLLYAALVVLIGAASTSLLRVRRQAAAGGVSSSRSPSPLAVVALCVLVWAEKVLVGAPSLLPLFLTREGQYLLALGVALVLCIGAVVLVDLWPARWSLLGARGDGRRRRPRPRPRGACRLAVVGRGCSTSSCSGCT